MQTISIVIPVYNRARIVERTLQSVLAQEYRPLQVVLVDNDSSDDTLAVLNRWASAHEAPDLEVKVVSESYHTAGAARNKGASVATGEWLVFFDSDDEMHPSLVSRYAGEVEKARGEIDIVSTGASLRYADGTSQSLPFHNADIMAVQILNSQLATQRYMVRASYFHERGEWNVHCPVWNDWELGIRLLLGNPRVVFMPGQLVTVNHSGAASITGDGFASKAGRWENTIGMVKKELSASDHPEKSRLLRLLEFKRIILAAQYEREGEHNLSFELCDNAYGRLRDSYGNGLKWKLLVAPVVKLLYSRIVAGKRGAAAVARRLL